MTYSIFSYLFLFYSYKKILIESYEMWCYDDDDGFFYAPHEKYTKKVFPCSICECKSDGVAKCEKHKYCDSLNCTDPSLLDYKCCLELDCIYSLSNYNMKKYGYIYATIISIIFFLVSIIFVTCYYNKNYISRPNGRGRIQIPNLRVRYSQLRRQSEQPIT